MNTTGANTEETMRFLFVKRWKKTVNVSNSNNPFLYLNPLHKEWTVHPLNKTKTHTAQDLNKSSNKPIQQVQLVAKSTNPLPTSTNKMSLKLINNNLKRLLLSSNQWLMTNTSTDMMTITAHPKEVLSTQWVQLTATTKQPNLPFLQLLNPKLHLEQKANSNTN